MQDGDYTIVVEGLFSWDTPSAHGNMQDIVHILKKYEFDYTLFLLSGDYETLWTRNTKRDHVVPESEFRSLYDHVMQKTSDDEVHLDVCKLTPEEVSNILRRLLE